MGTPIRCTAEVALIVMTLLSFTLPDQASAQGESAVPFLLIAPNSRAAGMG